jgi:mRNA interferase MazF
MRRGDIVTVAFAGDFGKPRPAVIVQSDYLNDTHATILVCPFTSELVDAPLIRIPVTPSEENGLRSPSQIMVDKTAPMRREKIGARIGVLDPETMVRLNRSLAVVFGLVS